LAKNCDTQFGFVWGPASVDRLLCNNVKGREWVYLSVKSIPSNSKRKFTASEIGILVHPGGSISVGKFKGRVKFAGYKKKVKKHPYK
jgi:hypothetical protein